MVIMPVTGYLGTGADTVYFNITQFRETAIYDYLIIQILGLDWETFEAPMDFIHKDIGGSLVMWILIALHVGAALFHHFVRHDDVLRRMLPGSFIERSKQGDIK
jgi:cytochrome b561